MVFSFGENNFMLRIIKNKIHILQNIYIKNNYFFKKKEYSPEDNIIAKLSKKIKNGFYVDIGAHHPLDQNNTCLLFKKGWSGVNIDINEFSIKLFKYIRPHDLNVRTIISNKNKILNLYYQKQFSFLNTTNLKIAKKHFNNNFKTKKVRSQTLDYLLNRSVFKNKKIDFLNIDVEGAEIEVLNGIDFKMYKPRIICIEILEAHYFKKKNRNSDLLKNNVYKFLIQKKYKRVWSCKYFRNHIFIK